uniref:Uncharacterized protein n=1 Tax=Anguilla anguilla TaxID=7936 RepID=A0A0E9XL65_ANGAN
MKAMVRKTQFHTYKHLRKLLPLCPLHLLTMSCVD